MNLRFTDLFLLAAGFFGLALFGGWLSENISQVLGDFIALVGLLAASATVTILWLEWEQR